MLDRRAMLARVAGLVLGGGILTGATAGDETVDEPTIQSDVSIALEPSVLELTGIPEPVEPAFAQAKRATGVSLADVDAVSASGTVRGGSLTSGWATMTGSFDPAHSAGQLLSERSELDVLDNEHVTGTFDGQSDLQGDGPGTVTQPEMRVLADRQESSAIGIQPSQFSLATGSDLPAAVARLRSALTNPDRKPGPELPGGVLDGDAVVHATVGDDVPTVVRSRFEAVPDSVVELLRAVRWGGVAVDVRQETSQVRYAVRINREAPSDSVITSLIDDLVAFEEVDLLRSSAGASLLVTDVAVATDSLWRSHGQLFDIEW